MASREYVEVAGLQFEYDSTRDARFFARSRPNPLRQTEDDGLRLGQGHVGFEGIFGRDGLCGSVGNDGTVVDAARELVEPDTVASKAAFAWA